MVRNIAGGLLIAAGVVLGLSLGVWVFVSGIVDIIDGAKENPTDEWRIVWGILEVTPLAELAGWLTFWVLALLGGSLMGKKRSPQRLRRSRR